MKNPLSTMPLEISHDAENLKISWKDGVASNYNLLELRKKCPCAKCRGGHGGNIGDATSHIKKITLLSWRKMGRYALSFSWSDYHDSGIYTFDYLRELGE
ncbi:MAG: DUF971 domain-containing protein [Leptospiraceae bacterium]|nr:DUF971 domain-containing protein [Leptospiraceae bacterium]MCK6380376.1 DUF971 domain-containing protein [Leptospiraceae bacterium]NUM41313.1 DUF971 domain-containing protein [Leptospiraceae bacterium]